MLIYLVSGVRDLCVDIFGLRCQGPVLRFGLRSLTGLRCQGHMC